MTTIRQGIAELRARFPVADMDAERQRLDILDRIVESVRVHDGRVQALEWALGAGLAITESYRGGFVASAEFDEDKVFERGETLADLADELARIRERMEAKP